MPIAKSLTKVIASTVVVGAVFAASLTPLAAAGALVVSKTQKTMESNLKDLTDGSAPGVTTITDVTGKPMAFIYGQRRYQIPGEDISPWMKAAIVSVEDRRFFEHDGVDWQGTLRAMARNILSGKVEQGASTLDQQYVKNYLLLVDATDKAEQKAATETSYARKLREMKMASELDARLSKDEILTRYLNVVPFGNGAFGVEAAAQTYFGVPAKKLTLTQAAMLAGIVQSSSVLNPYTNAKGVTERRNTVLDTMVASGAIKAQTAAQAKKAPLGVLPHPAKLVNGCINAGDEGFFCDYVIKYLNEHGLDINAMKKGSYTITTSLDPNVQKAAHEAAVSQANPTANGVAAVINVVAPGKDSRRILAMTTSRDYGLDQKKHQTVFPLTSTQLGSGAGSVFKIFTTAVALEKGLGINSTVKVPARVELSGMGEGGAKNCPKGKYCVENAGKYKAEMPLHDALAFSPNTTFVNLISKVGVKDTVDMAVRLGLRDYAKPGSFNKTASIADYVTNHNLGSFTLGPLAVNPLQLSNVAATLASGGVWCEPNPIVSITNALGKRVDIRQTPCEQVLDAGIADTLAQGLSHDVTVGTASRSAKSLGWRTPTASKTGTTETHNSSAFLGFNDRFAAATYIFNDGTTIKPLCTSPLRQCPDGNLYGGMEAARIWFKTAQIAKFPTQGVLPPATDEYVTGNQGADLPPVSGLSAEDATAELKKAGYNVTTRIVRGRGVPKSRAIRVVATTKPLMVGDTVTLELSDGSKYVPPPVIVRVPKYVAPAPTMSINPAPRPSRTPPPRRKPRSNQTIGDVITDLLGNL